MEKHLLLTDLDGTLLTDEKKVSPAVLEALESFVSQGNIYAICTGRDINSARSVYYELGLKLKNSYVIAYNGGQIYDIDNSRTVYRTGIDQKIVCDILNMAKEHNIHIHTYNDDFILSTGYNECMDFYRKVIKTPLIVADDISGFMKEPPCKMICIELHDHEKQERFREAVVEKYGDVLNLMYSNDSYLELIPKESGKGNALIRLADILGIRRELTMAAGDEENDISMIEAAGFGVAMCNASEKVRNTADAVTESDNNHDGLAKMIMRFISE